MKKSAMTKLSSCDVGQGRVMKLSRCDVYGNHPGKYRVKSFGMDTVFCQACADEAEETCKRLAGAKREPEEKV